MENKHGYKPDPECRHCKGSGGVSTGQNEYSTCPCINENNQRTSITQMKQVQTFKFDPDLIDELKKESGSVSSPFNRYVENLLRTHPYRIKLVITHHDRKKK